MPANALSQDSLLKLHSRNKVNNTKKFKIPLDVLKCYLTLEASKALVLDVGSFAGSFLDSCLSVNGLESLQIIAFEPFPGNFSQLKSKYSAFGITVEQLAVGNSKGDATFSIPNDSWIDDRSYGGRLVRRGMESLIGVETQIPVKSISLSDYLDEKSLPIPSLIKVDVQGGETDVVLGLEQHLREVPFFYIECQLLNGRDLKLLNLLLDSSYEVFMDGFQFGFNKSLAKEAVLTACDEMGIVIDSFSSSSCVYGKAHSTRFMLDSIMNNTHSSFTYFQTDLLCVNKRNEFARQAAEAVIGYN